MVSECWANAMAEVPNFMPSSSSTTGSGPSMVLQPIAAPFNPFGNSLSQGMTIKLDQENFLLIKFIILAFVKGSNLMNIC
ncbi:hypothetical protein Syun_016950 [Stephania yunnanensis]|uniref:Uncharacterized protein n=1 Tax=Stephania yunnanensis TaxID=152371 RepID=A0AAP0P2L9_9MAGN